MDVDPKHSLFKLQPSRDADFFARLHAKCGGRFQKAETTPAKAARGAFFAKGAKNASCKERAKVKVKTLGEKSPVVPYVNLADQPS
ncbi:MAG: hypothetical protein H7834_07900 [Magnetococcus sp. YQC-9]